MTAEKISELKRLYAQIANVPLGGIGGRIVNAFPSLIAALEAAEEERDERTTMAARAQEAMRYLLNGLPATDAIWAAYGNADSARAWLAARDARLKAEGAAEWLECHRNDDWLAVDQRERFDREAAELRREAGE